MGAFPLLVENTAAARDLGRVEARYRQNIIMDTSFAACFVVGGLIGLFAAEGGALLAVLLLLVLPGVALSIATWRKFQRHIYVCADGLIRTDGPHVREAFAWKDVAHVREWTTVMRTMEGAERFYRCKVLLADGRELNLAAPPYLDGEQMAATIAARVSATLYPVAVRRLAQEGRVEFGPLTVTREGLLDAGRVTRWADIGALEVGRVRLKVRDRAGHTVISRQVRPIPDLAVLLALTSRELPASVQRIGRLEP